MSNEEEVASGGVRRMCRTKHRAGPHEKSPAESLQGQKSQGLWEASEAPSAQSAGLYKQNAVVGS